MFGNPVAGSSGPALIHPVGWKPTIGHRHEFRVSQPYGCTGVVQEPPRGKCPHFHPAIDIISGDCGRPIVAAEDGKVLIAGKPSWSLGAQVVRIDHPQLGGANPFRTDYAHLQVGLLVKKGQLVKRGQLLGHMGTTGLSTGCHLHFVVKRRSNAGRWYDVDPWPLLDQNI